MKRLPVLLLSGFLIVTLSGKVAAQESDPCEKVSCSNHGDCIIKGGDPVCACHEGDTPDETTGLSCQSVSLTKKATSAEPQNPLVSNNTDRGWALGAAITGFVSAPVFLALGAGAVATTQEGHENTVPIAIGGSALLVIGVMGPVVNAGARTTRYSAGVNGVLGLRILAWSLYGLTLANGVAEIVLAVSDIEVEKWEVAILAGTGTASLIFFAANALASHRQARRKMEQSASFENRLLMSPIVSPVVTNGETSGAVLGMMGTF